MIEQITKPDFDSIRQLTKEGMEYWSARDLSKLLRYDHWRFTTKSAKKFVI